MNSALTAILGYAIGTAQVLFVDWWRRRRKTVRQLRLIRAELRQLQERSQGRFNRDSDRGPDSDSTPNPPRLSSQYSEVIAATDFYLTDEHDDDNTLQALINLVDGVELLRRYHADTLDLMDKAEAADAPIMQRALRNRAVETAAAYDREANRLEYMVRSAVEDTQRRLGLMGFWTQLKRTIRGRLPEGENPPLLKGQDDPRLSGRAASEEHSHSDPDGDKPTPT